MSDYVYDNTSIPFPKTDKKGLGGGDDPTKFVAATDWNTLCQGVTDLRNAVKAGQYHGLARQASTPPTPASGKAVIFWRSNGLSTPNTRDQLCTLTPTGEIVVIMETAAS